MRGQFLCSPWLCAWQRYISSAKPSCLAYLAPVSELECLAWSPSCFLVYVPGILLFLCSGLSAWLARRFFPGSSAGMVFILPTSFSAPYCNLLLFGLLSLAVSSVHMPRRVRPASSSELWLQAYSFYSSVLRASANDNVVFYVSRICMRH